MSLVIPVLCGLISASRMREPMPTLSGLLDLTRCPHCRIHRPTLSQRWTDKTTTHAGRRTRHWSTYSCMNCGGVVLASADNPSGLTKEIFPEPTDVPSVLPEPARSYLAQALDSLHAPAGAVMLAASAVDAMLKQKGYSEGSLFARINQAASDHLITPEMAEWAHEVRLDANDQRHADKNVPLPSDQDAQRSLEFTQALAQFLFVLPDRVKRGRSATTEKGSPPSA